MHLMRALAALFGRYGTKDTTPPAPLVFRATPVFGAYTELRAPRKDDAAAEHHTPRINVLAEPMAAPYAYLQPPVQVPEELFHENIMTPEDHNAAVCFTAFPSGTAPRSPPVAEHHKNKADLSNDTLNPPGARAYRTCLPTSFYG